MSMELIVPPAGESITEAVVAKWHKQPGDAVAAEDLLAELETDKITLEVRAPEAGVLAKQLQPVGAKVRIGDSIGQIEPGAAPQRPAPPTAETPRAQSAPKAPAPEAPKPPAPQAAPPSPPPGEAPRGLSPTQRRHLREHGEVPAAPAPRAPAAPAGPGPAPIPAPASDADEEVVPMSPLRQRIAQRLVEAQHTAAILTTFNEVDMTNVQELRARHQDAFVKKHGVKLGFMSFFIRAAVEALKSFPGVNAEVRGDSIVYKKHYHIGVAVGSGRGLVVPVLRHADRMRMADMERALAELAQKAKDNKLTLADLSGGTFTISNGGIYGSLMSTPLLNMPQTGILGMHNIVRRPIAVGEQILIRPMMYLALSYDHRVVDGREAVQCLVQIKEQLEQPEKLLLGL